MRMQNKIAHILGIFTWIALCFEPYVLGMVFPKWCIPIFIGFAFFHFILYKKLTVWENENES